MNFDEIMKEIESGLSGEPEEDIAYLRSQSEKYKEHEYSKEIIRAIGRMMYELLSDDKKEELESLINQDSLGVKKTLEEVDYYTYKGNYTKVESLMKELIAKIEELNLFDDDSVSEYHDFQEYFEEVLYRFIYRPEKVLRGTSIPLSRIYLHYGSTLVELEKYDEAEVALKKALKWNPVSADATFEYLDLIKRTGRLEEFFQEAIKSFKIAFRPAQLARCYRDIAYYFVENKMWREASSCDLYSLEFDKEKRQYVQSELYYIQSEAGMVIEPLTIEELEVLAEKYGFPVGGAPDVIELAYTLGKKFVEREQYEVARYMFEIVYGFVPAEEIKELMDALPD